ncbi:MAG TPA: Ig-like domain repeat protein [Candidatus Sulfotelmatobacter sp.]
MRGTSSLPKVLFCVAVLALAVALASTPLAAQYADAMPLASSSTSLIPSTTSLITQPVDEHQLIVLKGNVHPLARPQSDLGTAPASLPMQRMLLVLKRSPEQESALRKLLDDQQDKHSPSYHKWLTPEQYGNQFGPSDSDMQAITGWLQSHGFQLGAPSRGRTVLEFSGSASQVQDAFHTTIHKYVVSGEEYWSNADDPSIPTALTPAIAGVRSLNNFPKKPMNVLAGVGEQDPKTGKIHPAQPLITFPSGCDENNSVSDYCSNWLGPYDFATIYDVLPLWNAGIDGTGVTVAIVGESDIQMSDVQAFRSFFGLPANNPVFVLNGPDPGIQADESEADIDVQWSGAVAKGATIDFVISQSTETTSGTDLSAVYIVENNLAAVMSESYGECELGLGTTGNQFYNTLWQQASAQGITVLISAGDGGSAGCDNFDASSPAPAQYGLQVSGYASTPYNVAVGGTDFNDFNDPGTYWSTINNPTTQESALKYIPESTWNDSCTNALWEMFSQLSTNPETNCNNPNLNDVIIVAGSGGVSKCTTPSGSTPSSCAGGYARPSWQTGSGSFSADAKRDIPDVSLFASNGFVGHAYVVCDADAQGACPSSFVGFGGTSVSSPAFAGIMALVNQKTGERQGNANYVLYKLAAQQPSAFHDVTVGTNAVPCATGSPNCTTTIAGDSYGILSGYNAAAGYDLATGLGSVDANNLVTKWSLVTLSPSTTTLSSLTPTTVTHGQAVNFTVSVAPKSGTGTPTGSIALEGGPASSTGGIAGFSLANGAVSGSTEMLPGGTYSVTAHYPGDSTYEASESSPISVTVSKENSQPQVFLVTFDSSNKVLSANTNTAVYGSPYILRVNLDNAAGHACAPVASSGATACPTGSVTLTNNGSTLDAGTFALNSYGYVEDLAVQLPGGTDSVMAAYAGDESFNASSVTTAISITPAPTTIPPPLGGNSTLIAGSTTFFYVTIQSSSSGAAPTGTVTLYANGTALPVTPSYSGTAGSPGYGASLTAFFQTTFTTSGTKAITASYSGDSNYGASTSSATSVSVLYPTTEILMSSAQVVSSGTPVTLTALVDTTQKNPALTGTFTFYSTNGVLTGAPTITQVTDSSGYSALQATLTVTITSIIDFSFQYSGDSNYVGGFSNDIEIGVPDFSIFPVSNGVTITAGQTQQLGFNVNALYGFTGTVGNFTCSGLPAETTCIFSPTQLASGGTTTLTITTAAIGQLRQRVSSEPLKRLWLLQGSLLLGVCLIGISKRRWHTGIILLICVLVLFPSCGGGAGVNEAAGGGTGGGGDGTMPNPTPSITSLAPSQIVAGSTSVPTVLVNGSGFLSTSAVTYAGVQHPAVINNGSQIGLELSASDVATVGKFPVVVTNPSPGGGNSNSMDFNVMTGTPTGFFTITVTATSGSLSHTATFYLTVQ